MYTDFYESFVFLKRHPKFKNKFIEHALDIEVVKVNPKTEKIEDDKSLNTQVNVWLECGEYSKEYKSFVHDLDLDTGGKTFEEAIIQLANLVSVHYGEYTEEERVEAEEKWYKEEMEALERM